MHIRPSWGTCVDRFKRCDMSLVDLVAFRTIVGQAASSAGLDDAPVELEEHGTLVARK